MSKKTWIKTVRHEMKALTLADKIALYQIERKYKIHVALRIKGF